MKILSHKKNHGHNIQLYTRVGGVTPETLETLKYFLNKLADHQ